MKIQTPKQLQLQKLKDKRKQIVRDGKYMDYQTYITLILQKTMKIYTPKQLKEAKLKLAADNISGSYNPCGEIFMEPYIETIFPRLNLKINSFPIITNFVGQYS